MSHFELIETRWRVRDPQKGEVTCGIYLTESGYDVRSVSEGNELVRTQWARDLDAAHIIADGWLRALRDAGGIEELSASAS